jgi:hypothetical protein
VKVFCVLIIAVVVIPDLGLYPEGNAEAMVRDSRRVLAWVTKHISSVSYPLSQLVITATWPNGTVIADTLLGRPAEIPARSTSQATASARTLRSSPSRKKQS